MGNRKRGHCSAPSISGGPLLRNPEDPWQWKTSSVEAGRQSGILSLAMSLRIGLLALGVNKNILRQLIGVEDSQPQKATGHRLYIPCLDTRKDSTRDWARNHGLHAWRIPVYRN